jgi:hypothetical protein
LVNDTIANFIDQLEILGKASFVGFGTAPAMHQASQQGVSIMVHRSIRRHTLTGIAFALALTLPALPAAAAPAGSEPDSLNKWQETVEQQIDRSLRTPEGIRNGQLLTARVSFGFDAEGHALSHRVIQPTGVDSADREVERLADAMTFPRLPLSLRGRPRSVEMQILFATPSTRAALREAVTSSRAAMSALARRVDGGVQEASIVQNSPG